MIPSGTRIWPAAGFTGMRRGFAGLAAIVREKLAVDPFARLAFSLLRAFLNWCADRPEYRAFVHADACASRLARDELPKKAAKDDCLQREQLPLWFEHVRKLANPVHSAYAGENS